MRCDPARRRFAAVIALAALLISVVACGDLATPQPRGASTQASVATPAASVRAGGKPAAPQARSDATSSPGDETDSEALGATAVRDGDATVTADETATADETVTAAVVAPTDGRWIDVNVSDFAVHLMEGSNVMRTIAPVAVGVEVDTGNFTSTQTGLFYVYNKIGGLQYDAPYDSYISDWVGFDVDKQNGFHSFLKDKDGKDTVTSTGRVSNGCIRSAAAADIFAFADIGMPVLVHV
jgi:L,D-transpeptidase catalytic domain